MLIDLILLRNPFTDRIDYAGMLLKCVLQEVTLTWISHLDIETFVGRLHKAKEASRRIECLGGVKVSPVALLVAKHRIDFIRLKICVPHGAHFHGRVTRRRIEITEIWIINRLDG